MRIVLDLAAVMPPCAQEHGASGGTVAGASGRAVESWAAARVCRRLEFDMLSSGCGEAQDCGSRSGALRVVPRCAVGMRVSAEAPAEDWDGQVWFDLALCAGGAFGAEVEGADRQVGGGEGFGCVCRVV